MHSTAPPGSIPPPTRGHITTPHIPGPRVIDSRRKGRVNINRTADKTTSEFEKHG
jgi:hypothetical protein